MDARVRHALANGRTIEITTTGRRTGRPQRIEIWFHNLDGRLYLTGLPGSRGWYANLRARPELTFHLKAGVQADLRARATPIEEPARRRAVLSRILARLGQAGELEAWVRASPLVEVTILEPEPRAT
jgi:deazaflavin-dependent oxidoreductase (nitroreductase family)